MMAKPSVAVQMYTLRDLSEKDFVGTLGNVARIGYAGVELAGTFGLSAKELKRTLSELGLRTAGAHVGIELFEDKFDETIAYYREAGVDTLIIPWWPENRRGSRELWLAAAQQFDQLATRLTPLGFRLCYHNHDFEFQKYDDKFALDLIYENARGLGIELDAFWVTYAGVDPVAYINQHAGRVVNLHVKDLEAGPERRFTQVGKGIIKWQPILKAAEDQGAEWFVVEQDNCYDVPPLESITTSFKYLQQIGAV
jgi:sugar phosphate isomerase/epimerase